MIVGTAVLTIIMGRTFPTILREQRSLYQLVQQLLLEQVETTRVPGTSMIILFYVKTSIVKYCNIVCLKNLSS